MSSKRRSRSWLRASFASQYRLFRRGLFPWSGHPCQKQPSTKTASLARVNTMSGRIARDFSDGFIGWSTRYRRPREKRAARRAFSGFVSRRRLPCMVARTAALDALGGGGSSAMPGIYAGGQRLGQGDRRIGVLADERKRLTCSASSLSWTSLRRRESRRHMSVSFESHRRCDPAPQANALRPFKPKVASSNLVGLIPLLAV
jgi:hypothetical protein